ncbi:hypothetical protein A0H81_06245 [Grifola frondosa]|uniref:Uncharacterized protein n=1 Tax=Grifola frondosa TaxID=5627 RepID=A0A1C7MB06_GRIFR|nr:hypothetical protein A0H81_06245 [Grifola frondosa]
MSTSSYLPASTVVARPAPTARRKPSQGIPPEKRAAVESDKKAKKKELELELEAWYQTSKDLSVELSKKFGRQPEYYLRLMFSNGSKLQASRKPNAFNAWVHHKAKEVNENAVCGSATLLADIQQDSLDDYHKLSQAEKLTYVKELEEERDSRGSSVRLTQRRRKQDVKKVCEQVEDMAIASVSNFSTASS